MTTMARGVSNCGAPSRNGIGKALVHFARQMD